MGISVGTPQYLCGIDVGTTGSKTMIFSLDGSVAGKAYREYGCQYPKPGWVEQDIDMVLREGFRKLSRGIGTVGHPTGAGGSGGIVYAEDDFHFSRQG